MFRCWAFVPVVWALTLGCSGSDSHPAPLAMGGQGASGGGGAVTGGGGTSASGGSTTGGASGMAGAAGGPDLAQVKLWAEEVTLGPEYGGTGEVTSRWVTSPTLSVMQGTATERVHLEELVPQLSSLIAPLKIEVVSNGDTNANIEVYFTTLAAFDSIAQSKGFPYVAGNWGYFYTNWNTAHEIEKAYVLLAVDMIPSADLRHFTFEETTQSLGLSSDSAIFPESVFFANGSDGGNATELSTLDQHLVKFFYTSVQPGDGKAVLDAAFDASW